MNLIECCELTKIFEYQKKQLKVVDNVSFSIKKNTIFGLIGESGSGKTTIARMIVKLLNPTSGSIFFEDTPLKILKHPYKKIQMIFQDPYLSLNPTMTIQEIILEPLKILKKLETSQKDKIAISLLEKINLEKKFLNRFPHELSGGERQRIAIARSLSINPTFIILDEPLSSLDLITKTNMVKLLKELQKEYDLTYLLISHDLSSVYNLADEIAVIYLGQIVEIASKDLIFSNPKHPYTKFLIESQHTLVKKPLKILKGEAPSLLTELRGCSFYPRCPYAKDICKIKKPTLSKESFHKVSCHLS